MTNHLNVTITADRARFAVTEYLNPTKIGQFEILTEAVMTATTVAFAPEHKGNLTPIAAMISRASEGKGARAKALQAALERIENCAKAHSVKCAEAKKAKADIPDWTMAFDSALAAFNETMQNHFAEAMAKAEVSKNKSAATREEKKAKAEAEAEAEAVRVAELESRVAELVSIDVIIAGIFAGNADMMRIGKRIAEAMAKAEAVTQKPKVTKGKRIAEAEAEALPLAA